jgi:predicted transcriptional regulator
MLVELKPEHKEILDRAAAKSGMSQEEVLDQAFAVIQDQFQNEEWLLANRKAISDQIDEGFDQSERGELYDAEQAAQILRERRGKRQVA